MSDYKLIPTSEEQQDEFEMEDLVEKKELHPHIAVGSSRTNNCKAMSSYIYAFCSSLFFASGSMLVKLSAGQLNSLQIVMIRCFVQLFVCVIYIAYNRLNIWNQFPTKTKILLLGRGTFGGIGLVLFFYAFQNMPLGDASTITFSSPIYVLILARVFLGEKFGCFELVVIISSFCGVVLISRPTFLFSQEHNFNTSIHQGNISVIIISSPLQHQELNRPLGALSAFLGSLVASCGYVTLRSLSKVHFTITILYFSLIGIVLTSSIAVISKNFLLPSNFMPWVLAFMVGIFGISGQIFMTKAFQMENAGPISLIRQLDIVFAYILQIAMFHDPVRMLSGVGAFLVISGSCAVAVKKWLNIRNKQ